MTEEEKAADIEWLHRMVAIEEETGGFFGVGGSWYKPDKTWADVKHELGLDHLREQMLAERITIRYKMGKRWFKACAPPLNAFEACIEVSRIYNLPGVSHVISYDENGEQCENWKKSFWRQDTKQTHRDWKE
jgi:hypothetical protein